MDPLQKALKNMNHCATPSLAKIYKENSCMRIKMQDHKDCCNCQEACCEMKISDANIEKQNGVSHE